MAGNLHKELISLYTKKETKLTDEIFMGAIESHCGLQIMRLGGNESKKVVTVKEKLMMFLLKKIFMCGMNGISSFPSRVRNHWSEPRLGKVLSIFL